MTVRARGVLVALLFTVALVPAGSAQRKPAVAVMPAGYFRADAESAQHVTQGLVDQFRKRGYRVIPMERSQATFESMRLSSNRHLSGTGGEFVRVRRSCVAPTFRSADSPDGSPAPPTAGEFATSTLSDRVAFRFGDAMGADLVAYPRLLSVGVPASDRSEEASRTHPSVILLLRVLNVHNGQAIFVRQISHRFDAGDAPEGGYRLTQADATAAVAELIQPYFQRVAGTRQEYRRPR